jgi:hypothetical protein
MKVIKYKINIKLWEIIHTVIIGPKKKKVKKPLSNTKMSHSIVLSKK